MSKYISNIKIENIDNKINIINIKNTKFEKLIVEKNIIPDFPHSLLTFNILNTKSSFVNAIRRCILDEILVKALYFNMTDIRTNDRFILNDLIQERIQLIPLLQNIGINKKFSLVAHNNTTSIISIYTDSIKDNDNSDTIYFNQNIKLFDLRPNKTISINNIHINENYGYINNIYSIGRASYEVINFDMKNNQSLNSNPTDFKFYIYSNGNISTYDILSKSINELENRLKKIKNLIQDYTEENDELIINKTNKLTIYYIKNEYHTLGNLLVDYMFDLDKSTNLLNYNNSHPSKNEITIKTDNPDSDKLITMAIDNIIIDFNKIKSILIK